MNHLLRSHAPISDLGWTQIDDEAKERLEPALGARKLVDFSGPLGWQHSATTLGRTASLGDSPVDGVSALARQVLPLVELRADFTVARSELRDIDRGALDADFDALDRAAHQIATAENTAILHGWADVVQGVAELAPYPGRQLGNDALAFPRAVSAAVSALLASGIGGPYGLALDPEHHRLATEAAEHGGTLLIEHLREILGGPIVWTPGVIGGAVLSLRGGDFLLESGQDLSVGYASHDAEHVQLYIQESFSFRVATPEAAVALKP
ncbi:MAG TPA: family 1 encapsulin nanocompartment shell protein [Solirubrobacteraceae bacterium]|nr:family 1 encapsulin nanocompartment shell protein [Solirubrobacteraceae bacterium]